MVRHGVFNIPVHNVLGRAREAAGVWGMVLLRTRERQAHASPFHLSLLPGSWRSFGVPSPDWPVVRPTGRSVPAWAQKRGRPGFLIWRPLRTTAALEAGHSVVGEKGILNCPPELTGINKQRNKQINKYFAGGRVRM